MLDVRGPVRAAAPGLYGVRRSCDALAPRSDPRVSQRAPPGALCVPHARAKGDVVPRRRAHSALARAGRRARQRGARGAARRRGLHRCRRRGLALRRGGRRPRLAARLAQWLLWPRHSPRAARGHRRRRDEGEAAARRGRERRGERRERVVWERRQRGERGGGGGRGRSERRALGAAAAPAGGAPPTARASPPRRGRVAVQVRSH